MYSEHFTSQLASRLLGGDSYPDVHDDSHGMSAADEEHHSEFGVHITYEDLFASIVFFAGIYASGAVASRFLLMPSLVGEVVAGILLGPPLLNFVPNAQAFVMLGEIGLVLLVIEAGIDMNLTTLRLVGARGVAIAIIGSILPISFGIGIALSIGIDIKGAVAAGSAFGPTSLGIAMNILRSAKIINTPVGQMIVAAAIIDDMIALIILSQLRALSGTFSVVGTVVPIVSALGFLIIGGFVAIFILPALLDRLVFRHLPQAARGAASLGVMFLLLLLLMPATFYAKASFLMGAFVAGLAFCSNHEAHTMFVSQFKRILQWLMRVFFAASIGFQVPVGQFSSFPVLVRGLFFAAALAGKLAVGLLVPNFTLSRRFTGLHLRDCLVVGFSMAAEGEFAFVIAVFAVDSGLIDVDLYASIVLAVLLSTILAPFLLRLTINKFKRRTENQIQQAHKLESARNMKLDHNDKEDQLMEGILNETTVFLCIQTQSAPSWGLLAKIMQATLNLKLDIIDHRSWHPRGVNTTLVNEIYAQDSISAESGMAENALANRIEEVENAISSAIGQQDAKIKVKRWFPGVLQAIADEEELNKSMGTPAHRSSVTEILAQEVDKALEADKERQMGATTGRDADEIMEMEKMEEMEAGGITTSQHRRRRKTRSTPTAGGDIFSEEETPQKPNSRESNGDDLIGNGQTAGLLINGAFFNVRVDARAISRILRDVQNQEMNKQVLLGASELQYLPSYNDELTVLNQLQGFVRRQNTQG